MTLTEGMVLLGMFVWFVFLPTVGVLCLLGFMGG